MRITDIGVGTRLGVGFGIITLLMLMIGFFAFTGLAGLNREVETIVSDRLPKVVVAKDIIDNANVNARALRNMVLFIDDKETVKNELKRVQDVRLLMARDIEKMDQIIKDTEGAAILKKLKDAVQGYLSVQDKCIELIEA